MIGEHIFNAAMAGDFRTAALAAARGEFKWSAFMGGLCDRHEARQGRTGFMMRGTSAAVLTPVRDDRRETFEERETRLRRERLKEIELANKRLYRDVASTPAERWRTAAHEAGHAIVAVCRFRNLRIISSASVFGRVTDEMAGFVRLNITNEEWRKRAVDSLHFLAGGYAGEMVYSAGSFAGRATSYGDGGDREVAGALLGREVRSDDPDWWCAVDGASRLIVDNSDAFTDLMHQLHAQEIMTGSEVTSIMARWPMRF